MTWEMHINPDIPSVSREQASPGPRLGFLESWEAAFDSHVRTQSLDGLAWYFSEQDEKQAAAAKANAVQYKPLYQRTYMKDGDELPRGWRYYYDIAKAMQDGKGDAVDVFKEHDEYIDKLNKENPHFRLKPLREMLDETQQKAKKAEARDALPSTLGGYLGGFLGGAVAGLDPRTDIWNTVTTPIGFGASTIGRRLLMQGAGQAGIESINQLFGVQENRRLLGLAHGNTHALTAIGAAAAGGVAIQGVGEAAALAARRVSTGRWFPDAPGPFPAPAGPPALRPVRMPELPDLQPAGPPPDVNFLNYQLALSRSGLPRAYSDLNHIENVLSRWGGGRPWEIAPPTETRLPGQAYGEGPSLSSRVDVPGPRGGDTVDDIARRVDPGLFVTYDKLADRKQRLQQWVKDVAFRRESVADEATVDLRAKVADLERRVENTSKKSRNKMTERLAEARAELEEARAPFRTVDSPDEALIRKRLMEVDEQMRDLAPSVSRAYARAEKKWDAYGPDRKAIEDMMAEGRKTRGPVLGEAPDDLVPLAPKVQEGSAAGIKLEPTTPKDFVPELKNQELKPNESLAQAATRVSAEYKTVAEQAIDNWKDNLRKAAQDGNAFEVDVGLEGRKVKIDLDNDVIEIDTFDGMGTRKVNVRNMLDEINEGDDVLKAVSTCSLK